MKNNVFYIFADTGSCSHFYTCETRCLAFYRVFGKNVFENNFTKKIGAKMITKQ